MKFFTVFGLCFFFCSLFSQAAYAQDFSSIDSDLQTLEDLIADTQRDTEELQKLLEDLQQNLSESWELIESYESIISRQEQLLADFYANSDTGNGTD
jgi:septal ring factor EnvC (AmiA/AmiB activator)